MGMTRNWDRSPTHGPMGLCNRIEHKGLTLEQMGMTRNWDRSPTHGPTWASATE